MLSERVDAAATSLKVGGVGVTVWRGLCIVDEAEAVAYFAYRASLPIGPRHILRDPYSHAPDYLLATPPLALALILRLALSSL